MYINYLFYRMILEMKRF